MNHSPGNHATSLNLWTLGHRRFYSPLLRAPGGGSAAIHMAASFDWPDGGKRGGPAAAANAALVTPVAAMRASDHAHGVQ